MHSSGTNTPTKASKGVLDPLGNMASTSDRVVGAQSDVKRQSLMQKALEKQERRQSSFLRGSVLKKGLVQLKSTRRRIYENDDEDDEKGSVSALVVPVNKGKLQGGSTMVLPLDTARSNVSQKKKLPGIVTRVDSADQDENGSGNADATFDANANKRKKPEKISIWHEELKEDFPYVLDWDNPFRRVWDLVIILAVVYLSVTVPMDIAFVDMKFSKGIGTAMDVLFWIDIVLNFRTGFVHNGIHIKDPKHIAEHYLHSWFFIDLLASIPFEVLIGDAFDKSTRKSLKILKWLKIPKLLRIGRILKYLRRNIKYYYIVGSLIVMVLMIHIVGCVWVIITVPCDVLDEGAPVPKFQYSIYDCSQYDMVQFYFLAARMSLKLMFQVNDAYEFVNYIDRGIYESAWSNQTVNRRLAADTTVQQQNLPQYYPHEAWSTWTFFTPERYMQNAYLEILSFLGMLIGFFISTAMIAEMVVFALNRMEDYYKFYNKVDRFKQEMIAMHLPEETQYRVSRYYDYIYANKVFGTGDNGILNDSELSLPLKKEIALNAHGNILCELSIFQGFSHDFLAEIAMKLKTRVFLPGDTIFEKGDLAQELFIIRKGIIAVRYGEVDQFESNATHGSSKVLRISETKRNLMDDKEYGFSTASGFDGSDIKLMTTGSFFGEIALLMEMPRSCSVYSKTISELNTLSKSDFQEVMRSYSELNEDLIARLYQLYPGLQKAMIYKKRKEEQELEVQKQKEMEADEQEKLKATERHQATQGPAFDSALLETIIDKAVEKILAKIDNSTRQIIYDQMAERTQPLEDIVEEEQEQKQKGHCRKVSTLFNIDDIASELTNERRESEFQ